MLGNWLVTTARRNHTTLRNELLSKNNRFGILRLSQPYHRNSVAYFSSSTYQPPLQGRQFRLSEADARDSFLNWFQEFVPNEPNVPTTLTSIRPVLVPFFGLRSEDGRRRFAVYGGYEFSDPQVESLKIDPSEWRSFNPSVLDNNDLVLDTWSITAKQAAHKFEKSMGDEVRISTDNYQQALLPGYIVEFTRRGLQYKVIVGAHTGKASGLKHFSFFGGVREVLGTLLRAGSPFFNSQLAIFLVIIMLPRLIPPLGLGMLFWGMFRAYISPVISLGIEKVMLRLPPQYKLSAPATVERILNNQWGHYDPKSSESFQDAHQRDLFKHLFGDFERILRQQQEYQRQRQQQYQEYQRQQEQQYQQHYQQQRQQQQNYSQQQQKREEYYQRPPPPPGGGYQEPPKEDPYQVLGVSRNATSDELRQAFRKKLLQYHPDQYKGSDPEYAKMKTQQVVEAYRSLTRKK